jgi:hypothetical protein
MIALSRENKIKLKCPGIEELNHSSSGAQKSPSMVVLQKTATDLKYKSNRGAASSHSHAIKTVLSIILSLRSIYI